MSAFDAASKVEARSWEILRPFVEVRSFDGRYVRTAKGRLARELQRTVGDVLYNHDDETVWSIEIKAEEKFTGNLFIERWSNRSRFTPGWLETLNCDLLLYHFLGNDSLYGYNFYKLRQWFYWGENGRHPAAHNYPQVKQRKYSQLNDTWGYLVPIDAIPKATAVGSWHPERMATEGAACT